MGELLIPSYLLDNTSEVVGTYLIIKSIFGYNECDQNLVMPEAIALFQYKTCKPTRYYLNKIRQNLDELVKIDLLTPTDAGGYIINASQLKVEPPFVKIESEIFKLLINDFKLLLHYLIIKRGRSYQIHVNGRNSVVCCLSLEYFAKQENVVPRTIIKYNQQLEDLKLIYINRSQYKVGDECREINIYSLYEDKEYADAYRPGYEKDTQKSNDRRKVAALYNSYCKNPSKYSPEEKAEIREMVVKYNEDCLTLGQRQPDYLKKIKNMDIFDLF